LPDSGDYAAPAQAYLVYGRVYFARRCMDKKDVQPQVREPLRRGMGKSLLLFSMKISGLRPVCRRHILQKILVLQNDC
jgi:hypothetical protein